MGGSLSIPMLRLLLLQSEAARARKIPGGAEIHLTSYVERALQWSLHGAFGKSCVVVGRVGVEAEIAPAGHGGADGAASRGGQEGTTASA